MTKITPQIIQITLLTGDIAPRIRSAQTFDEATSIVSGMRHSITGSQSEKIDYTIAYEDGFLFSGTSKIRREEYVDFSELATASIRDYLSDDPDVRQMIAKIDPSGNRRASLRHIAEKYEFGSWLSDTPHQSSGMKI
jgi:hypothetical protein